MIIIDILCILIPSYLIGGILFAKIVSKLAGIGDIVLQGSKNPGATNVARLGGKKLGFITLVLDMLKGACAIWLGLAIADFVSSSCSYEITKDIVLGTSSAGVTLGHIYPCWSKFKGGKGVATFIGVLCAVKPYFGMAAIFIWVISFLLTKISSLSSMIAITFSVMVMLYYLEPYTAVCILCSAILVVYRHADNIKRLVEDKEEPIN